MSQTTQNLKADINAGETGDKLADKTDLGLSTLGTDDEAAGTPNTPQQIATARKLETRKVPKVRVPQLTELAQLGGPAMWVIVGAILVVVVTVIAAGLTPRS